MLNIITYIAKAQGLHKKQINPVMCQLIKGECSVFLKKIISWMKTIHYLNTIRSHLVTITPMTPFTPNSTSKLRTALHIRYLKVIPRFVSCANTAES